MSPTRVSATRRFFFGGSSTWSFPDFESNTVASGLDAATDCVDASCSTPTELAGVSGGSTRFAGTTAGDIARVIEGVFDLTGTRAGETEGRGAEDSEGVLAGVKAVDEVVTGTECACATAWNCSDCC